MSDDGDIKERDDQVIARGKEGTKALVEGTKALVSVQRWRTVSVIGQTALWLAFFAFIIHECNR